jgi:hypothetical protein
MHIVVCDLENLKNEEAVTRTGSQRHRKKKICSTPFFLYSMAKTTSLSSFPSVTPNGQNRGESRAALDIVVKQKGLPNLPETDP